MEDITVIFNNTTYYVPEEILMAIFGYFSAAELTLTVSFVSRSWCQRAQHENFWKKLYKKRWKNTYVILMDRPWFKVYKDRYEVEKTYLNAKREEIDKKEQEEISKSKDMESFSVFRYSRYLVYGETLKDSVDNLNESEKIRVLLVSNENYATCIALNHKNCVGYFNWGHLLVYLAKILVGLKNPLADSLFHDAFDKYDQALKLNYNPIKEDTLSRWGDALHDYAKTKKTRAEVEYWLEKSYEKYQKSVGLQPNYIAYDYWGLTLYTHAKLKKNDEQESDKLYADAVEKYTRAHTLKPEDGYILCHWATAIQNQAMLKVGPEARRLYGLAFTLFQQATILLPKDVYTCRSWGDALHDCSKKLIQEAEETECSPERKEELLQDANSLLEQASEKFANALILRPDYTNAMNNWGLSMSTHAKILEPEKSEEYFKEAYTKFEQALLMTNTDHSFIICNWAMTMVSQARKRITSEKNVGDLLEKAREKLLNQIEKGDTWGIFCMARWCSVANKYDECREWLEKYQIKDNYLPRATKGQMSYFKNVQHYEWFKNIIQKAKEDSKENIDFS